MANRAVVVVSAGATADDIKTNPTMEDWLWFEPESGKWHDFKDGEWVEAPVPDHSHPTHGDINFTGTVSADGDAGLTGQRTVGGYKLTFKKGLLVGFEAA